MINRRLKSKLFFTGMLILSIIALLLMFSVQLVLWIKGLPVLLLNGLRILYDIPPLPSSSQPIGGLGPSLIGSLISAGLAMLFASIVSILLAYVSVELQHKRISSVLKLTSTALYGIPTITVSMIVYSTICLHMGRQSILAGALALTIVAIPMEFTYFESIFSSIPLTYKEAGYSMGLSRGQVLKKIVLGIGKAGVVSSLVAVFARIMGETAPMLFTIGNNFSSFAFNLFEPSSTVTTLIFAYAASPYKVQVDFAWGASLVLYIIYMIFSLASKLVKEVEL
jgi:phosphate transport system permease protein